MAPLPEKKNKSCFQYTLGSLFMDHLLGTVWWVSDTWEIFAATSVFYKNNEPDLLIGQ